MSVWIIVGISCLIVYIIWTLILFFLKWRRFWKLVRLKEWKNMNKGERKKLWEYSWEMSIVYCLMGFVIIGILFIFA